MDVPSLIDLPMHRLLSEFAEFAFIMSVSILIHFPFVCGIAMVITGIIEASDMRCSIYVSFLLEIVEIACTYWLIRDLSDHNIIFRTVVAIAIAIPAQILWYVSAPWQCHVCDNSTEEICDDCNKITCPWHLTVQNKHALCGPCAERKK